MHLSLDMRYNFTSRDAVIYTGNPLYLCAHPDTGKGFVDLSLPGTSTLKLTVSALYYGKYPICEHALQFYCIYRNVTFDAGY